MLELARRARHAADVRELKFMAVNDTHSLVPYRQAALWQLNTGVIALSGVVQVEANVPYAQWLKRVGFALHGKVEQAREIVKADLAPAQATDWSHWLPAHGLWLPLPQLSGGLLLARDQAWSQGDIAMIVEWLDVWSHAWQAKFPPEPWSWRQALARFKTYILPKPGVLWYKQRHMQWICAIVAVLLFPVRLTVLAPGELVPANAAVIRSPLDGVVGSFAVKPNEHVKTGQLLFSFDEASLASRFEVAQQALTTAEAEYRQAAQLAVTDVKFKAQLATLAGKIEERRAEALYLQGQFERSQVGSPRDGIALVDDPSEWIGKPVQTGERIMRVAAPDDVEVEAWLAIGDAIPIKVGSPVHLYLNASPLFSVSAAVRYVAHDAVQRPDGTYAYRMRATLDSKTSHRVGLKGTAKLTGSWAPVCYWMMRRPIAIIRQFVGW